MFALTDQEQETLDRLSERIQRWRVNKEPVVDFAARVGVSAPTYLRLEKGDPRATLGVLVRTLWLAGKLKDLDDLLAPTDAEALFEEPLPERKRAARRNRKKKL